jgi:hypothetical protein
MILTRDVLDGIERGTISCAFRRWRRPSVRSGGTLLTAAGQLQIREVAPVTAAEISENDAVRSGHQSRDALLAALDERPDGELYRIEFGGLAADPRVALRTQATLSTAEVGALRAKLDRLDGAAPGGAWTRRTLVAIRDHEGLRAADLCRLVGQERLPFKVNVRKLKTLGLTESLEVGYRVSSRGRALLAALAGG